ncbi:MAG: AAA family ATPase [Acidobacteria bacterium]|nr:AAA family ATPase [Acidobacteriota bacterium]
MSAEEPVKEVSIITVSTLIRKRRWTIIITSILVTAAVVYYAITEPSTYQAEALLSADAPQVEEMIKMPSAPNNPVNVGEKLWMVRENLFSPTVLVPLVKEFQLDRRSNDLLTRLETSWNNLNAQIGFPAPVATEPQQREEITIDNLKKKIHIKVEAPDAFSIAFQDESPERSREVTNRLADALVQRTSATIHQNANFAAEFLKSEVQRVKAKLDSQNAAIQAYQAVNTDDLSTRMAADLRTIESQQEKIHAKTEQISNEQARRTAIEKEIQDLESRGALETRENMAAETRLQELRLKLKQLQAMYTDQHPELRSTQSEIRDLEKALASGASKGSTRGEPSAAQMRYLALKSELEATTQRIDALRKQQNDMVAQMAVFRRKAESAPRNERNVAQLVRDYELTRTQYQNLLQKQTEAQVNERLNRVNQNSVFRVVRRASIPLEPSGPHRARLMVMGVVAGLGLGMLFAFVAELRDSSYEDADEFQESVDVPVLATIPAIPMADSTSLAPARRATLPSSGVRTLDLEKTTTRRAVVTLNDPRSIAAEQYGMLALEIRQRLGRDSSRVLAITSAAGGEGKTITSLNLSIALSKTMEGKVLLVDSDLRKPRIHECVGFKPDKGFGDLLQRPDDALDSYIRRVNGLAIIPGGNAIEDPLRYLGSERCNALFQRFRKQFEFIVVDTPPILPVADSRMLSGYADGVLIVVRARHTRRELFKYAMRGFRVPNLIGVVLNGVDYERSRYSDAYEYYTNEYLGRASRKRA